MAQTLDLVVDRAVLLDVGIRRRNVCLGLIVVEVRDEILHGVFWEELTKLGAELGGKRLVVAEDQGRFLNQLDRARHGHRLAAAGDSEERLHAVAALDPTGQRLRRLGLIARQCEGRNEGELLSHCLP